MYTSPIAIFTTAPGLLALQMEVLSALVKISLFQTARSQVSPDQAYPQAASPLIMAVRLVQPWAM
jgi:hypothetical protein